MSTSQTPRLTWFVSRHRAANPPLPSVVQCLAVLVAVKFALATVGLGLTIRWLRRRAAHSPTADLISDEAVESLEYTVAMAAALYPGRAECLERSIALFYLARRIGIPVTYHHGAQPMPFRAHAWIEYRGRIINDVPEHVRYFRRFPQVCP